MSPITLTLCASTRTGCLSAAISACAEVTLTLAGDLTLPSGTSLALLTPRGTTLAHTILSEQAAPGAALPLSTLTAQAAEYTRSCRAGDTREALLAIGDSEHPIALVPARIAQNPLYTLAPPTAQAPAYPTSEALHALLAEIQAAALRAENAQASATSAQSKAEAAQGSAEAAATSASDSAKVAASSEQAALTAKQAAEASQVQAKASETAAKASETAAKGSETAASASETAAKASEQAAAESATAAAASANAAKASETAAAESATSASASATAAKASANAASSSATAAAKSAAASASSASAAAKSATDLAEAVATANSLDGRISAIENGVGIYRADNGKIYTYKPFYTDTGKGDGTLAIAYEHDLYKVVAPVEDVAAKEERYVVPGHDGVYYAFFRGWSSGNYGPHRLYLYNDNLKRVFATEYFTGGYTSLGTFGESSITSSYVVFGGRVYVRQKNLAYWRIYDLASQKLLSSVNLGATYGSLCSNPKTGHLLFTTASVAYLVDENLAFVTDENGEKVTVAYPAEVTGTSGVGYWWCHRLFCGWTFLWNHTCPFMLRLDSDAEGNDVFSICRECLCVNGEDGTVDHEVDENGDPVKDSISTVICVPKNTSEGDIIPFHKSGTQEFSGETIAVNYGPPVFNDIRNPRNMSQRYLGIIYNGVEQYVLLSDGRLLSLQRMNLDTWNFVHQEWKYNGVFTALESKKKPAKYVDDKHYLIPLAPQNMSYSGRTDCSTPHYIAANAGEINAFNVRNVEASYGLNNVTINPVQVGNHARTGYSDYMRDGVFVGPGCVYLTDIKTFYHRFF